MTEAGMETTNEAIKNSVRETGAPVASRISVDLITFFILAEEVSVYEVWFAAGLSAAAAWL